MRLVTGSNGFLGVALVERLLAHGYSDLGCLVRPGSKDARLKKVLASFTPREGQVAPKIVTGTISTTEEAAKVVSEATTIYHLAASLGGAAADMFLNSVVASKKMLDAIVSTGRKPRIVYVSSFGVYGIAEAGRGHVVTEETPLEAHPEKRDLYSHTKLRQEELFREYEAKHGLPMTIVRPGVIYGPSGSAFSSRVGIAFPGFFLYLGGDNILPLSYVDNCAESIVVAGESPKAVGQTYNLHDDDLVTAKEYMRRYEKAVKSVRKVKLPFPALMAVSHLVERYHAWSKGQLPAVFTPYKSKTTWGGNQFDNAKIKSLGYRQLVSTEEGLSRTFAALKERG